VILPDINVLVYAFRTEHPRHAEYEGWLTRTLEAPEAYGISELVLSGLLRVVTNPRAFQHPNKIEDALDFADALRGQPNCVLVAPGPRHWSIFQDLCRKAEARGNLIPDAYLAALAIESGCEWITADRDYARFPGLKWRHPLE
jgi:hypothetical protein